MCISDESIENLTLKNEPNTIKDEPNFQEYWTVSYFKVLYLTIKGRLVTACNSNYNCLYSLFTQ